MRQYITGILYVRNRQIVFKIFLSAMNSKESIFGQCLFSVLYEMFFFFCQSSELWLSSTKKTEIVRK